MLIRNGVCLIQFSTQTADYLVDPLALDDLTYLAPIFSDPNIEKISMLLSIDVLGLPTRFSTLSFANIFDTMLAARTLGTNKWGRSLLSEKFCVMWISTTRRLIGAAPVPPSLID